MSGRGIVLSGLVFFCLALLVAVVGALAVQTESESNNDYSSADPIDTGERLNGDLYRNYGWGRDTIDVYQFNVTSGQGIFIDYSQGVGAMLRIHLVEHKTATDHWNERMSTTGATKEFWTAAETASGTWNIVVEIDDPRPLQVTSYMLNMSLVNPNDAGYGKDIPDVTGTPQHLNYLFEVPYILRGHLGNLDTRDCYNIQMGEGQIIDIQFTSYSSVQQTLRVFDYDFNELKNTISQDGDSSVISFYTANETPADENFYITSEGPSTAVDFYEISFIISCQDDLGLEKDAAGTKAGADILPLPFAYGTLCDLDDSDIYKYLLPPNEEILVRINLIGRDLKAKIVVFDESNNVLWEEYYTDGVSHFHYTKERDSQEEWIYLNISTYGSEEKCIQYWVKGMSFIQDDFELGKDAGGSLNTADEITPNEKGDYSIKYGVVGVLDRYDTYKISAGEGDVIEYGWGDYPDDYGEYPNPPIARLLDKDGNIIRIIDFVDYDRRAIYVTAHETPISFYYVQVTQASFAPKNWGHMYKLFICVYKQWEGMDEYGDGPRSIATAEPINVDHTYPGIVADLDLMDVYTFETGRGKIIEVTFESNVFGGRGLDLMFSKADDVGLRSLHANVQTGPQSFQYYTDKDTPIQWWYISINTSKFIIPVEDDPTYELTVRLLDQNDGDMMEDAGSSLGSAMETLFGHGTSHRSGSWSGVVADEDGVDIYWFESGNGEVIKISCVNQIDYQYIDMTLYDSGGNAIEDQKIDRMYHSGETEGERIASYITADDTPMQPFYIEIKPQSESAHTEYVILVQIMMQFDGYPGVEEESDAPIGIDNTKPISTDVSYYKGVIGDLDYRDCFSFQYGPGQVLSIGFSVWREEDSQAGQVLSLRNPLNEIVLELVREPGEEVWGTFISSRETPIEDWYVQVEFTDPASFRNDTYYSFRIVLQDQGESDISPGTDAPSNNDEAKSTHYMDGVLEDLDVQDNYRFEAGGGQIIRIHFNPGPFEPNGTVEPWNEWRYIAGYNVTWKLLDKDGATIYSFDEGVETTFEYITAYETPMQWWYLVVEGDGRYRFFVTTQYQNDAASGRDAAASQEHAVNPPMSIPIKGIMGDLDTMDVYAVMVMPNWNLTVDVTKEQDACMTVSVVNQAGDQVGTLIVPYRDTNAFGKFLIPADTPSDAFWYLKFMVGKDWWGEYGFEVGFEPRGNPEAPDVEHYQPSPMYNETEGLTITVSVTDSDGVASVTIHYRLEGETDWKSMEMTADGDVWSVTIPPDDLESGKRLLYYIVAEDNLGEEQQYGSVTNPLNLELETLPTAKVEDSKLDMVFGLVVGILAGVLLGLLVARSRSAN